jgi:hypothetical protein
MTEKILITIKVKQDEKDVWKLTILRLALLALKNKN